jgi:hypothetical protein
MPYALHRLAAVHYNPSTEVVVALFHAPAFALAHLPGQLCRSVCCWFSLTAAQLGISRQMNGPIPQRSSSLDRYTWPLFNVKRTLLFCRSRHLPSHPSADPFHRDQKNYLGLTRQRNHSALTGARSLFKTWWEIHFTTHVRKPRIQTKTSMVKVPYI